MILIVNLINRTLSTRIMALTLALSVAGFVVVPPGRSQAQQDRERQIVRTGSESQSAGKRIALVIGNGAYTSAPPLKNPPNDARDMAATLKALGFDVTSGINVNQREMKRMIREFGQKLKTGGSGLFYYAGHGVQSKGRNYLIPVDANITSEAEVEDSGVDVGLVLNFMDDAQNGLNIVILDACRNNPFSRSFRSASDGLAQVDAPTGTLIAYATAPGRVASDGTGQNGLYTSELLKQMRVPGLSATEMFMRVRAEVMKQTASKQVPWEASSLVGSFYFRGGATASNSGTNNADPSETKFDAAAFEYSYWETIKNSTNADDFKAYLAKYPDGQFATLAKNRINSLGSAKPDESKPVSNSTSGGEFTFWESIKNSTSIDDYNAYLKKYPNGEFVELAKSRLRSLEAAVAEKKKKDKDEQAKREEETKLTKTFRGTFGLKYWGSKVGTGALTVSPSRFVFKDNDGSEIGLVCSDFIKANVNDSKINDIAQTHQHKSRVDTTKSRTYHDQARFTAASPADAVSALDLIKTICRKLGQ